MQEELTEFTRLEVWDLVSRPKEANVIGTKWIFKNKSDKKRNICQEQDTISSTRIHWSRMGQFRRNLRSYGRLEAIRLLLTVACHLNQDVSDGCEKCILNEFLTKGVWGSTPPWLCLQTKEGVAWVEVGAQSIVRKTHWISSTPWPVWGEGKERILSCDIYMLMT